ncbi:DUF2752 domain-containing protein [Gordonia sp. Z-3]|jgi:hypothetical protein|uniref:DUF2752 domain-containing protein n=2 Tax=Gordonia TaxID=2053 RepID=A0A9X3D7E5_9ACTN|nr:MULTISPECIES: DUF2752 domain-containing protein [Gordonia]MAU84779.1 hypothetical protein [Gordonia sp. (in: high G+C Gram-positive bacteria)]MCF3939840.1 DUF2752 domain-containing protein [Gordonia tangerina]MCX2966549.1 DUF2752 domain-containing protein [Gordonia aquimaris]MED5799743.1 DUF2752 domain-containing protein [Gordonia sp. Z-3]
MGAAVAVSPTTLSSGPGVCPFAHLTGLPCPGCGLTRSWVALGHGDVVGAIGFNWFGPLSMAVAVIVTAIALWTALTGGGALRRVQHVLTGRIAMSVLVVWLGYGLVRILDAGFGWGLFPLVV